MKHPLQCFDGHRLRVSAPRHRAPLLPGPGAHAKWRNSMSPAPSSGDHTTPSSSSDGDAPWSDMSPSDISLPETLPALLPEAPPPSEMSSLASEAPAISIRCMRRRHWASPADEAAEVRLCTSSGPLSLLPPLSLPLSLSAAMEPAAAARRGKVACCRARRPDGITCGTCTQAPSSSRGLLAAGQAVRLERRQVRAAA